MLRLLLIATFVSALVNRATARDLFVNPATGDDGANGLAAHATGANGPVKSIARGLKLAGPGDTVHLAPATYRECAVFHNRAGEPGKPITLDGHGATLDGSEPLNPAEWQEVSSGVFRHDNLLRLDAAVIGRWFFLFDGKMNHMNRTSKGPSAPLKKPEELQPGEWTFVKDPGREKPGSRQVFGSFHIKLVPGRKLADARIAAPVRSAGVQLSGTNAHLVVRNLAATHVYNDGYNVHGSSRDCVFENIRAIECGDDGFSAHDDCQVRVDGFVSIGNSTGICDVGNSVSDYNRVFIRDCLGHDLFFLDTNRHSVSNAVVLSSAARTLTVTGRDNTNAVCTVVLDNVFIRRETGSNEVRVARNGVLDARRVTLVGLNFQATGGEVKLHESAIAGSPSPEITLWRAVRWQADQNVYDARFLRLDSKFYSAKDFGDFQRATGQDRHSRWQSVDVLEGTPRGLPPGVGADAETLLKHWGNEPLR